MKKFESIICEPEDMDTLGIKWAENSKVERDEKALDSGDYNLTDIWAWADVFEKGFNHICKDENGEYFAVKLDGDDNPLIWRKVEPTVELIPQVSFEAYLAGREHGYDDFACSHGYAVFGGDYYTADGDFGFIEGTHIERMDVMEGYNDEFWWYDSDAAKHYEECEGKKIIRDIPGLDAVFIDTPENRESIIKQLERIKPSIVGVINDATQRSKEQSVGSSKNDIEIEKE